MKNFIIVVETAFIAFVLGVGMGATWERKEIEEENNKKESTENPA